MCLLFSFCSTQLSLSSSPFLDNHTVPLHLLSLYLSISLSFSLPFLFHMSVYQCDLFKNCEIFSLFISLSTQNRKYKHHHLLHLTLTRYSTTRVCRSFFSFSLSLCPSLLFFSCVRVCVSLNAHVWGFLLQRSQTAVANQVAPAACKKNIYMIASCVGLAHPPLTFNQKSLLCAKAKY